MKKVLTLVFFGAIVLVTMIYFKPHKKATPLPHDFLIIAEHNGAQIVRELRSMMTPVINIIIQQELDLSASEQSPVFKTPPHYNLTLYYIFNWIAKKDDLLVQKINDAFGSNVIPAFEVSLDEPAFFGSNNDEIVVKISDLEGFLSKINVLIKKALKSSHELYNFKKSEYFPYAPHIALGRLPVNDKRFFSSAEGLMCLNNIKKRIEEEVFPLIIQTIKASSKKIHVSSWCIYDIQQKKVIKSSLFLPMTNGFIARSA